MIPIETVRYLLPWVGPSNPSTGSYLTPSDPLSLVPWILNAAPPHVAYPPPSPLRFHVYSHIDLLICTVTLCLMQGTNYDGYKCLRQEGDENQKENFIAPGTSI